MVVGDLQIGDEKVTAWITWRSSFCSWKHSFNPKAFDASEGIFPVIDGVCGQFDDFVQQVPNKQG